MAWFDKVKVRANIRKYIVVDFGTFNTKRFGGLGDGFRDDFAHFFGDFTKRRGTVKSCRTLEKRSIRMVLLYRLPSRSYSRNDLFI